MTRSRRDFLNLTGAMASGALASPTIVRAHARRISQVELDAAVARHAIWLSDRAYGTRAVFANCDLSGLSFGSGTKTLVDLRGADFTEADLSGVTGDLVSFRRASLHYARLSWSRLVEPSFIDASLRGAIGDDVVWGWEMQEAAAGESSGAALFNCDAGETSFRSARIRGHFLDTNFVAASLVDADLSHSIFTGSHLQRTSFFGADLSGARFDHAEVAYACFGRATLTGADFSRAKIGPRVNFPAIC